MISPEPFGHQPPILLTCHPTTAGFCQRTAQIESHQHMTSDKKSYLTTQKETKTKTCTSSLSCPFPLCLAAGPVLARQDRCMWSTLAQASPKGQRHELSLFCQFSRHNAHMPHMTTWENLFACSCMDLLC